MQLLCLQLVAMMVANDFPKPQRLKRKGMLVLLYYSMSIALLWGFQSEASPALMPVAVNSL